MKNRYFQILIPLLLTMLLACSKKTENVKSLSSKSAGYFSIKDFTKDQWKTFHGKPYVLHQFVTLNGKTDSVMINALTMKWSHVFKKFFETDISDSKFLERYDFDMFEEPTTQTRTFTYTAKEPELYTQKLQIAADLYNNKIRNIYIETVKESFWNVQRQKLLYSPVHVIQIQEENDPLIGSTKNLSIVYKFL